ncbi:serine hydrolase domain-containing protein [Streptomyces mobaraensis]|uniref:serine hydrolase domain-containing protein n=1 Tax=Streptomyces mobaraensis TaxID=35621 RepID=UPI00331B00BC
MTVTVQHRRRTRTVTALLAATLLASAAPALAAPTGRDGTAGTGGTGRASGTSGHGTPDRDDLRRALRAVVADGIPGAVAEVRDEHGVWRGAAGVEDLRSGRLPSPDDRFRAGSVTKSLVATVVLQLVAEGRVGLDDPVDRRLPGVIPAGRHGKQITVRQLLHHTSGLPNYTDALVKSIGGDLGKLRARHWTPRELIALALTQPSPFEPGEKGQWGYSNTNYVVLGLLIERLTGHSLGHEIDRRVVRPLHLRNTSVPSDARLSGRHLHGYERFPRPTAPYTDITEYDPDVFRGPGNVVSNAHDLNTFYRALGEGRLLPARLNKEMRELTPDGGDRVGRSYGLGLEGTTNICADGTLMLGHTGSVPGYATFSFGTADGRRQVTLALGSDPDITKNDKAGADALRFLGAALCGKNGKGL